MRWDHSKFVVTMVLLDIKPKTVLRKSSAAQMWMVSITGLLSSLDINRISCLTHGTLHWPLRLSRNNCCVSSTVGASAQHQDLQLLLPSWIKIIACFSIELFLSSHSGSPRPRLWTLPISTIHLLFFSPVSVQSLFSH